MTENPEISLVIPLYNEEENLDALYQELVTVLNEINRPVEVIFVDDGSRDKSFQMVKELSALDNRIKRYLPFPELRSPGCSDSRIAACPWRNGDHPGCRPSASAQRNTPTH